MKVSCASPLGKEATIFEGKCARLTDRKNPTNLSKSVAKPRQRYDNLIGSATYMFHRLDRSLTRQRDGVL